MQLKIESITRAQIGGNDVPNAELPKGIGGPSPSPTPVTKGVCMRLRGTGWAQVESLLVLCHAAMGKSKGKGQAGKKKEEDDEDLDALLEDFKKNQVCMATKKRDVVRRQRVRFL